MQSSDAAILQRPAPELLAPAGNLLCAKAAVENGANAVYFGLEAGFNARARADNVTLEQLPELMDLLHGRDVRGYVTLNTLAFTDELPRLEKYIRQLARDGVDAVLVQDIGVARLVREVCPELEIHSSTQMTLTHDQAIEFATQLGISRVVLARELSLTEIRQIAAATTMPIEVFVHGALCVAYSGQCLTSESLGGRSANRGQCAQACRLPYDLVCDGKDVNLGDVRYLLSPQDLAAYPLVPELIDAGIASLKIEGRLKTPEYVANIVGNYRRAIDAAMHNRPIEWTNEQQREMELSFSRGFSPGWLQGNDHKRLVPGRSSAKRGVQVGRIIRKIRDRLLVDLTAPLAIGDGVVIEGGRLEGNEIGGRLFQIFKNGNSITEKVSGEVELAFAHGLLKDTEFFPGQLIWQTDDPQLTKRLRQSFSGEKPNFTLPVDLEVKISENEFLQLKASCQDKTFVVDSDFVPPLATKHSISTDILEKQLGRLGGSRFHLRHLNAVISGNPMVPLSVLGNLRKELVAQLESSFAANRRIVSDRNCLTKLLSEIESQPNSAENPTRSPSTQLRVLCRSLDQLQSAIRAQADSLIADFHDVRQYKEAVEMAAAANIDIALATLRIHKPGEDGLLKVLAKQTANRWLVRNMAAAKYAQDRAIEFDIDFSLNITNPLSASWWKQNGARRITTSYDLNRDQLLELVHATPSHWLEVVVHQHMPMFHMEHCVFCSVLSPGTNKTNCGRPCDRHEVKLRDRVGSLHVLHADIGCRNTLFNGTAQSGAEAVKPLIDQGVNLFRIELLADADQETVIQLVNLYRKLTQGKLQGSEVWKTLKADNRVGVTRGTLEQPRNPLAIL